MQQNTLFQEEITLFADVILPVPIPRYFTYRVPRAMVESIKKGARVIVQFGKNRILTAVVANIHQTPPEKYQAKYILELLDENPLVTAYQLDLFEWIANYYMCCVGEVMNVALPSGLKVTSQSRIQFNPDFDYVILLSLEETFLLEEVKKHQSVTFEDLAKIVGEKSITPLVKSLISKKAIILFEEVKEKYRPKIVKKVRLKRAYEGREELVNLISSLEKQAKQQEILLEYLKHIPVLQNPTANKDGLDKSVFSQGQTSDSSLATLIKNGIFEAFEIVVSRFADALPTSNVEIVLTDAQQKAVDEILQHFQEKDTVLLHGITGSGKTEVYIELIQQVLAGGSQVLYLLPEIALTTQIVVRLKKVFGDKMGIYHSRFSDNERVEVWQGVVDGKFSFVVGVRSSIFLPFDNLGLIIVDEEHETSYKQYDPAPRYHARDVAMVIAQKQNAKVLLGSATPSLESYYQAKQGRFGLVNLHQRYGDAVLPQISTIDLRAERKKKTMQNDFSSVLVAAIKQNIKDKQQSILFQNRRGYSPYLNCQECNWIGECQHCAVSLTYHLHSGELRCHYCGHKEPVPRVCPACGSGKVKTKGFGTEKIEDDLKVMFPDARTIRMDLDTTRTKSAYQQIIGEVESGNVDILVGTQMISKGLDFDKVSLVGIFDADRMIYFPDFRASERAFQMITQVSGRAGRRGEQGNVLIQTGNPNQGILKRIIENDYVGFYQEEIQERQAYHYPPFVRVISLTVRHVEQPKAEAGAKALAEKLTAKLGKERVLGPEKALIERLRNQFLFDILIKLEKERLNLKAAKDFIKNCIDEILLDKTHKGLDVVIDVDAV